MPRNRTEILAHKGLGFGDVDVPGYHKHRVVWSIVCREESADVGDRRSVEVSHRAYRGVRVRPIAKNHLIHFQQGGPVCLVVITQPFLFDGVLWFLRLVR